MLKLSAKPHKKSVEVEADGETPLLDLLESKGQSFPYGCRAGTCGTCRAHIISGKEHLQELTPSEEDTLHNTGDGPDVRLACRARPKAGATGEIQFEPVE